MKVRNLKANHNDWKDNGKGGVSVKVRNLKANHNTTSIMNFKTLAVLASVKVRNLKANHNFKRVLMQ